MNALLNFLIATKILVWKGDRCPITGKKYAEGFNMYNPLSYPIVILVLLVVFLLLLYGVFANLKDFAGDIIYRD